MNELIVDSSLYLGVHTGFTAKDDLYDVLTGDIIENCNVLQVFFGSPRSLAGVRRIAKDDARKSRDYMLEYDIKIFSHLPYIANFAREDSKDALNRLGSEIE